MSDDSNTTINELKQLIEAFNKERNWKRFHNLRSLAISLSLESNEFLEHFQWLSDKEVTKYELDKTKTAESAEELCDILWYLLTACQKLEIDVSQEFVKKLKKNKDKYPVEQFSTKMSKEADNEKYQKLRKEWENRKHK